MTLQAGIAKVDITPRTGHPMAGCPRLQSVEGTPLDVSGYVPRECTAAGIHDPLFARVLVLDNGQHKIAFVAVDLLVVTLAFTHRLRAIVSASTAIPPEGIVVAASHTHSGPDLYHWEDTDPAVEEMILYKIADAVCAAHAALRPARIGWADTVLDLISINRRRPDGPIDARVGVARIEDDRGRPLALLVNFAIHPIAVPCTNCLYSADIPGYATTTLEKAYDGAIALFLQGAAGNINPVAFPAYPKQDLVPVYRKTYHVGQPHPRTFRTAERLGRILASASMQAAEQVEVLESEIQLIARTISVELLCKPHDELVQYCRFMNFSQRYIHELLKSTVLSSEVQVIAIGRTLYIALPGEPFVEFGLALQKRLLPYRTYVVGYANDDVRYILPSKAYEENRYDTFGTPLARGSGETLEETAFALASDITQLFG